MRKLNPVAVVELFHYFGIIEVAIGAASMVLAKLKDQEAHVFGQFLKLIHILSFDLY